MTARETAFGDGEAYERLMGRWSRVAGDGFLDWLEAPRGLRWVDVGCGNGAFTEKLIERCAPADVDGVDQSEPQLAFARTRPAAKLARFREGDAQALPFADHSFDAATMALAIAFIPDAQKAVAEMARVVRPGGLVATYMWDIPNGGAPVDPLGRAAESIGIPRWLPPNPDASRLDELERLWTDAGLRSVETRVIRISVEFADVDDFWDSVSTPAGPPGRFILGLAPEDRERVRASLTNFLPVGGDGRIRFESVANAVKGRVPA
jgi:SAM-dependent methyltransferase